MTADPPATHARLLAGLPNALTVLRVVASLALLGWVHSPVVVVVLYVVCGVSDMVDGFLARRLGVSSELGARLDSLADLVFVAVVAVVTGLAVHLTPDVLLVAAAVAAVRVANLVVTRWRFRRWGILHTVGNKAAGAALFVLWPFCYASGYVPLWVLVVLAVATVVSAVEETVIVATATTYDPNVRGLWSLRRAAAGS